METGDKYEIYYIDYTVFDNGFLQRSNRVFFS